VALGEKWSMRVGKSAEFRTGGGLLAWLLFVVHFGDVDWEGAGICFWCWGVVESAFACRKEAIRAHEIKDIQASLFSSFLST